jgi:lipopolysaccharide/colanic/teichoic acid biosynthesis glycosyltransferase
MIILGNHYSFTETELAALRQHTLSLAQIACKGSEAQQIIDAIEAHLADKPRELILLNTQELLSDALLTYLTKLELRGIEFVEIAEFFESKLHKLLIHAEQPDIRFLADIRPFTIPQYLLKRLIDHVGAIAIGICASPVILYSLYRIRKESPEGPIFYPQERVGREGKAFTCYKFRSMIPDAEAGTPKFANQNDNRTFPWGAVMRRTRFDELPQLWNVIRGDMHLIGPRPERRYWVERFEQTIPYYDQRHIVKPGITGWAQIKYPYGSNVEDARQKLMYDLYYIKNWSLWLELQAIWKTIFVVVGRRGY